MADASVLVSKFEALQTALNAELVERTDEVHGSVLALASGQHVFFLGIPGIAKSFLVDRLLCRVEGADVYKRLLTRFTTPDEVFGPLDLIGYAEGHQRRLTERYLPTCTVAWIDEIWKANSAILNALLGIINERTFQNDAVDVAVPLSTLFCASNELPGDEGLAAIYDRVLLRYEVGNIVETGNFVEMLTGQIEGVPDTLLTWDEVEAAKLMVAGVPVDPDVFDALAEIRNALRAEGVEPSPRRFKQALGVLRGEAWLDAAEQVDRSHVVMLSHILWDRPEQRDVVARTVLKVADPFAQQIIDLLGVITKLSADLEEAIAMTEGEPRDRVALEVHKKMNRTSQEIDKLRRKTTNKRHLASLLTCRQNLRSATARMITGLFDAESA